MEGLLASFGSSKVYTQVKIMKFMGTIISGFLGEVFEEAKIIEEAGPMASLPKLLQVFRWSLEFESV